MIKRSFFFLTIIISCLQGFAQQKLTPVDAESKVHFVIRNFGINTGGDLKGLKGEIIFERNKLSSSNFNITVDVSTIDTDNDMRDNHLLEDDYFDVTKYPTIRISGNKVVASGSSFILKANLTIKDITKAIDIPFTATAQAAGTLFEGAFEINRLDFGVGDKSATMSDKLKVNLKVMAK